MFVAECDVWDHESWRCWIEAGTVQCLQKWGVPQDGSFEEIITRVSGFGVADLHANPN